MKKHTCSQCPLHFNYPSLLQRHQRIHTRNKLFHCTIPSCTKTFIRADTLKTHLNVHFGGGFTCCGKVFHSRASLKYHFSSCHVLKCPVCQRRVKDARELGEHMEGGHLRGGKEGKEGEGEEGEGEIVGEGERVKMQEEEQGDGEERKGKPQEKEGNEIETVIGSLESSIKEEFVA